MNRQSESNLGSSSPLLLRVRHDDHLWPPTHPCPTSTSTEGTAPQHSLRHLASGSPFQSQGTLPRGRARPHLGRCRRAAAKTSHQVLRLHRAATPDDCATRFPTGEELSGGGFSRCLHAPN